MRNVLVAVDGSEPSSRAVDLAASMARAFEARLTMAHSVPPPDQGSDRTLEPFHRAVAQVGSAVLLEACEKVQLPPEQVQTQLLFGPPAETISELAAKLEADVVVVGCRGRGAVARVLLGSVSERLLRICPRPLLIVH
jgi:nucleotide-binding universal stress UspA family protein